MQVSFCWRRCYLKSSRLWINICREHYERKEDNVHLFFVVFAYIPLMFMLLLLGQRFESDKTYSVDVVLVLEDA